MELGDEAFYGGAVGGGKSDALLMAALQFVDFPTYTALILRRTFQELNQPDAIMNRAHGWLQGKAKWNGNDKCYTFPSGAILKFGYMDTDVDKYQYQSARYHYVAFDEVSEFTEEMYTFLFSRQRDAKDLPFPIRMRCAANPGNQIGSYWVKKRFVDLKTRIAPFYASFWGENPHVDYVEYDKKIARMPPLQRQQLKNGDWNAIEGGQYQAHWFKRYERQGHNFIFPDEHVVTLENLGKFVTVDPACTAEETVRKGSDADYTVIGVYARLPWEAIAVLDVVRVRCGIERINDYVAEVCRQWNPLYVGYEALGFQMALLFEAKRRRDIPNVKALTYKKGTKTPNLKMKLARATDSILWAEEGKVFIPQDAHWLEEWLSELVSFTGDDTKDAHDDQVDSFAYAVNELTNGGFVAGADLSRDNRPRSPDLNFDRNRPHAAERRGLFGLGQSTRFSPDATINGFALQEYR